MPGTIEDALTAVARRLSLTHTNPESANGLCDLRIEGLVDGTAPRVDYTDTVAIPNRVNLSFVAKQVPFVNALLPHRLFDDQGSPVPAEPNSALSVVHATHPTDGVPGILGLIQGTVETVVQRHVIDPTVEVAIQVIDRSTQAELAEVYVRSSSGAPRRLRPTDTVPISDLLENRTIQLMIMPPFCEMSENLRQVMDITVSVRISATLSAPGAPPTRHLSERIRLDPIQLSLAAIPIPRILALFNLYDFDAAVETGEPTQHPYYNSRYSLRPRNGDRRFVALIVPSTLGDNAMRALTQIIGALNSAASTLRPFVEVADARIAQLASAIETVTSLTSGARGATVCHVADSTGYVRDLHDIVWESTWLGLGRTTPEDNVRSAMLFGPPGTRARLFVAPNGRTGQGALEMIASDIAITAIKRFNWETPPADNDPHAAIIPSPADAHVQVMADPRPPAMEKHTFENQFTSAWLQPS